MPTNYHAEFITGAVRATQFPPAELPEVAFVGRSNVGKSSLLNRLVGMRKLARVSGTPGCTREVNFFRVQGRWHFVDLPGYGYAQVPHQRRGGWEESVGAYLTARRDLRAVIVLLDIRRGVTDLDRQMIAWLQQLATPWQPVATKMDKLTGNKQRKALTDLNAESTRLGLFALGPVIACSALNGLGIDALRARLATLFDEKIQPDFSAKG
ncbi:MAG: YihA family ribosome biogenesis GTP-binding protein [Magnetococcales bacterium]|nr:YihA family ribosome biogenesis GTP-binding protein [Magnetococcales bacterium]